MTASGMILPFLHSRSMWRGNGSTLLIRSAPRRQRRDGGMAQLLRHLAIRHIDARKVEGLSNGLGAEIVAEFAH